MAKSARMSNPVVPVVPVAPSTPNATGATCATGATGATGATSEGDEVGAAELTRRVADNLRRLRRERALSLDDLSLRSGVSRATLSQVESCKTNPTIAILWKISSGLGVAFSGLLGDEKLERVRVLRRGEAQVLRSADGRLESRPLTPAGASPSVECYELRLAPRGLSQSEPHAHGCSESLTVLTGSLRLHVNGAVFDLGLGDSVFFEADVPHAYENPGRVEARYHNVIVYPR